MKFYLLDAIKKNILNMFTILDQMLILHRLDLQQSHMSQTQLIKNLIQINSDNSIRKYNGLNENKKFK